MRIPASDHPYRRRSATALSVIQREPGRSCLWFLLLFGFAVTMQVVVGAYRAEMGNYSDESAHFMNAFVLRDYLVHGLGTNPVAFAESYYLNLPKLAPLVWPPLFHVVLGLLLLPGWSPHMVALLFVALLWAWTAFRLSRFVALYSTNALARVVPLGVLLVPLMIDVGSVVMVDMAVAATALEATWWLYRYVVDGRRRDAVLFGLWAAACCLTKGNGVAIVLVPAVAVLLTRRFDLLARSGIYLSAAIVLVVAAPFVYLSYRVSASMGDFTARTGLDALGRSAFFASFLWRELTPVPAVLILVGLCAAVYRAWTSPRSAATTAPAVLVALALAGVIFHVVLALQYPSGRYVAMCVAPLLGLLPIGASVVAAAARRNSTDGFALTAIVIVALMALLVSRPAFAARRPLGFAQTINALADRGDVAGSRVLVVSDELGEGAFVTDMAMRRFTPSPTVIRASKLLTDGDWMGNHLQLLFSTPEATRQELEDLHVAYIVFDASPESQNTPYWSHVHAMLASTNSDAAPVYATAPRTLQDGRQAGREITVYRVLRHSPGPAKRLRIPLRYSTGKVLER